MPSNATTYQRGPTSKAGMRTRINDHLPKKGLMIAGFHPIVQSLLGTLLTWGLTAAGAALVFVFQGRAKVLK